MVRPVSRTPRRQGIDLELCPACGNNNKRRIQKTKSSRPPSRSAKCMPLSIRHES